MSMRKDLRACSKTPPISEKTSMCNPFIVSATLTLSTGLKAMFASAQPLAAIWNWNDIAGNAANRFSEGIIRRDGIKRHGLPCLFALPACRPETSTHVRISHRQTAKTFQLECGAISRYKNHTGQYRNREPPQCRQRILRSTHVLL